MAFRLAESDRPAQVFPPGDFIREELEARGWTQGDLARIVGRPLQAINAIINGKKAITPPTAAELGQAFGTSASLWMNLDVSYRMSLVPPANPAIARRAADLLRAVQQAEAGRTPPIKRGGSVKQSVKRATPRSIPGSPRRRPGVEEPKLGSPLEQINRPARRRSRAKVPV